MEKFKIKEETIEKLGKTFEFLVIIFAISIFACQPYLNDILIFSHDLGYHLNRIIEISNNLDLGIFPSLIHSGLLKKLGYANSLFYPELFLYIPAGLMNLLDLPILTIYKIFLIIITFFTFLTTYISSKGIFKKKSIAWLTSILYVFSLYRLTNVFVRGALGEILSFIFIPLIFYGLYEIIFGDNKKWWVISIGLFGIANSHVLTFLMIIAFVLLMCLININKILKNKKIFLHLFIAAILSILLCIGFFGPLLEQKYNDKFYVDEKTKIDAKTMKERSTSLSMILGSNLKSGDATNSNLNVNDLSEGIGAILFILTGFIFFRKEDKIEAYEMQFFIIGVITVFFTTSLFPWEKFEFLTIFQFPFRFNVISTMCFCFVGAKSFYEVVTNKKDSIIILSILVLLVSGYVLNSVNINVKSSYITNLNDVILGVSEQTGLSEYLPENTNLDDLTLYNINNRKTYIPFSKKGSKIEFKYSNKDIEMEINIPLIYYKGYVAHIIDEKGNKTKLNVSKNNENAHVLVKGDKNLEGTIVVEYKMTLIQKICYITTIITFVSFIIYIILKNKKEKIKIKQLTN